MREKLFFEALHHPWFSRTANGDYRVSYMARQWVALAARENLFKTRHKPVVIILVALTINIKQQIQRTTSCYCLIPRSIWSINERVSWVQLLNVPQKTFKIANFSLILSYLRGSAASTVLTMVHIDFYLISQISCVESIKVYGSISTIMNDTCRLRCNFACHLGARKKHNVFK